MSNKKSKPLAKLNGRPETVSIIFPVWRDTDVYYVSIKDIVSMVANWAVQQSPYDVPVNLTQALQFLTRLLRGNRKWDAVPSLEYCQMSCDDIRETLVDLFEQSPEIMSWNEKKVEGHNDVSSGCDGYNPDMDFIDLDALARNVSHSIMLDKLYNEAADTCLQGVQSGLRQHRNR